ncbi:class I SAM-dependent methyltransferase [Acidicapsa dinghuensis]|uniref:Class I SAM-dependent methyltransferase n=1 Tax=Acidicapsa dinghuensis TaxID=2218256 RepID=A0ABW1EEU7_9BACT|nr:class I SAM-dependent methyltransferase [Acidicapsa dinghuensis]
MRIAAEQRLQRAQTFDEIAELYDQGRREPPGWLYDTLFSSSGLDPAVARILEIGCGTGKSTLPLARRGCSVVALEMGANLAQVAQRNLAEFPRVRVVQTRFEDWITDYPFDLALAITAWHWIDPAVRYQKAAACLKAGGVLAFTVTEHAFPPGFDPFFEQIQEAYRAIGADNLSWPPPLPESIADQRAEIERSGLFGDVHVIRRVWSEEFTAEEHVALMQTASDHRLMEREKREWLFGEMRRLIEARPGGRIRKHNLTMLHLARRLP